LNEVDTVYPLRPSLRHFGVCHLAMDSKDEIKLGFGSDWARIGQDRLGRNLDVNTTTTLTIPLRFASTLHHQHWAGPAAYPWRLRSSGTRYIITLAYCLEPVRRAGLVQIHCIQARHRMPA